MGTHHKSFDEIIQGKSSFPELFPIVKLSVQGYFASAALLAHSKYLTLIYKKKFQKCQTCDENSNNYAKEVLRLYTVFYDADYAPDSAKEEADNNLPYIFDKLYYLLIKPFVVIYESQL